MSNLAEPRRPQVAAQNRKLRHLKGLSLRNLCLGRTASTSPDALSFLGENRLQQLVGDVFFSLHLKCEAEPVYVSELRHRSANFDFRFFDLASQPPAISRSPLVVVRVWATRPGRSEWIFVLDDVVDLRRLNFIRSLVGRRFPPNALVFHLDDGLYSLDFAAQAGEAKKNPPVAGSSYGSLMKLANLEASIRDALDTRDDLVAQIDVVLAQSPVDATDAALHDVERVQKYVTKQRRAISQAESRRHQLRASLAARRAAMTHGRQVQALAETEMTARRQALATEKALLDRTADLIHGQRRRICSDLTEIFPITPEREDTTAPPLSFRICNLALPNSRYDAATADEDILSAALGLAALLARHLQLYLCYPLPYPLCPYGSRSLARDDISHLTDARNAHHHHPHHQHHHHLHHLHHSNRPRREFPLYLPRGGSTTGQWRFEYGWFLLNKDIEALCASQSLRVVDIRHTLPNLKYLLYVCSAGSRDLPDRHKGGVRGLWAGHVRPTPLRSVDEHGAPASTSLSPSPSPPSSSPSSSPALVRSAGRDDAKMTLRTQGLREDVAG
ncbi:p63 related protein [Ophiocordyceps camponoti-floridani]|uniref:Autophagy-related protein 14 n=1 Tax=Ophiocordyceps camponoti-floridani TaxID=2030778 RepID=A0A8H4QAH0_9HYPO|nr:p63 related protein [Ophiocordyceps camponoti-floridani]